MTPSQPTSSQPSSAALDFAALWARARRLHPIYVELAREFVIEVPVCTDLEAQADTPGREAVEQAQQWFNDMDDRIQVHQLRQFLQTSTIVNSECMVVLLQHFLAKTSHTDASRDKIDFLLVQYFSQNAPSELDDNAADIAYVAQSLEPVLGSVEIKTPVWLNALDRVLDAARRCRSLDELLHGGVLEQGRKAKAQAGELFYLPIALVAFTRFGYLMRRVFFRLMLTDLNNILDGLTELDEKGIETIDCRRAQFSAQEPIVRLRMICQSWKVMFQAEYSSGQPLRMLVDLRASVDSALGRGPAAAASGAKPSAPAVTKAPAPVAAKAAAPAIAKPAPVKPAAPKAVAAAAGAKSAKPATPAKLAPKVEAEVDTETAAAAADAPEFEIAAQTPEWNPDETPQPAKKK
jgi:hypothetical protein